METTIVGEIGLNANGDVNIAKKLIDICSDLNIPYVKLQKRDIKICYTKEQLDSYRESPWGTTFRQQKKGLEFGLEQYQEIDDYCKEKGNIEWFASPWDMQSIAFLDYNFPHIPFLKIPSAKVTDEEYLKKCVDSGFDLIMSTGMCDLSMLQKAVLTVKEKLKFLLACTSSYPCPTKDINLNQIKFLSYYFRNPNCAIGWSDHSANILFPALSVAFGATMVEVHITTSRCLYGTDQSASLEPEGLRHLVKYIEAIEIGLGETDKEIRESEIPIIKKLRG